MIIGLTGKNASGKGEVAEYLKTKGFIYYSLSDALREEATKLGLEHSRDNLIKLGNELRQKDGPEVLAKRINKKIKGNNEKIIIDSIRSPLEAKELLKNKNFLLIGIDAPVELRFERLKERNRAGDSKTLEEFKKHEAQENSNDKNSQQLDATFKLSGKIIVNGGSLEQLHKKIDDLLEELTKVKF
jgi:dephospho-CoA kinase|tara:strand:- start:731 stop:1288 length:558 start_codon:yes stop_codon:yes gene_type:complete